MNAQRLSGLRPAVRALVRFDRSRITYLTAFQNAIGVFAPLAAGAAVNHTVLGLAASIGALNVCFSDRPGPYRLRAGRMIAVCVAGTLSALIGGLAGSIGWLTVALIAVWSVGGGILVVFGPAAEQIGLTCVLLLVVYGGFHPAPAETVVQAAFIFVGGLFQTALSVAAWPFRRFGPERTTLSAAFRELAAYTRSPTPADQAPPVSAEMTAAGTTLTGLGSARSAEAEALRVVLDETERIRLELVALQRVRTDMGDALHGHALAASLNELWVAVGELLDALAAATARRGPVVAGAGLLRLAERSVEAMHEAAGSRAGSDPVVAELLAHADALLGQLRACLEIVDAGSPAGAAAAGRAEAARPASLRLHEPFSVVRANLTLSSASFRHALRLAVTLAVASALARQFGLSRAYWVPLTAAIVLKPDFTSTFTRGVLRIAGTMLGLGLATLLAHLVLGDVAMRVILIGVFTFLIRSVGPANFGVSAVIITALVVILLSFAGAAPESAIRYRGLDTLIGGLLALAAYAVWPTWEKARTPGVLADMLDAYRRHVGAVFAAYLGTSPSDPAALDRLRLDARLARSNAEASLDRMRSEPADSAEDEDLADGIMANSHRFVHSAISLEASLYTATETAVPAALQRFADDVDLTLRSLSAALRDFPSTTRPETDKPGAGPDLRADQTALLRTAPPGGERSPLLLETERMTNSLNTMSDLVRRWQSTPQPPLPAPPRDLPVEHSA